MGEVDLDVRGKYTYMKKDRFRIRKQIKGKNYSFGSYSSLKEANIAKAIVIYFDWDISNLNETCNIFKVNDFYTVAVEDKSKIHFLAESNNLNNLKSNKDNLIRDFNEKIVKRNKQKAKTSKTNKHTNIHLINGEYSINKSLNGKNTTFGYYKYLEDAEFVKSLLTENNWDMDYFIDNNIFRKDDVFYLIKTIRGKIRVLGLFSSRHEAHNNADSLISEAEEYYGRLSESEYGKYIYKKYNDFIVQKFHNRKSIIFGKFDNIDKATIVRDILMDNEWDITVINKENNIFKVNNKFHILFEYEGSISYLGEFLSFDEANSKKDNLISEKISSIKNINSKQNRHRRRNIWTTKDGFEVFKNSDGNMVSYGIYPTIEEAIEARDKFEANGWVGDFDEDSLMNDLNTDNKLNEIIFKLTPWQKIVFDSIDSLGKEIFELDDLKQFESNFKRFAPVNKIESKVLKNLDDLSNLNLIEKMDGGFYKRLW